VDDDKTESEDLDSTETVRPQSPVLPERVGRYRILELLGEGGMGVVYLAEETEAVRRKVALKIIKHGMDTKQVVARFVAERQALAMMDHPCVAKVFDAGSTEGGRPYFAMEYVQGVPITEHCDRQRLTTRERLELFQQVCEGVQHAHQNAIIHRDLKPSNVLVSYRDGKTTPKIIDFGVAKAIRHRLTEKTLYTEMGVLIGTPEYMSPEQAEMTGQNVDTRTDVYSLGVVLYELVVGALPFESKELRQAGFDEIRRKIREDEPSKPSARLSTLGGERSTESAKRRRTDPSTLRRQLSGDLDWITMRALEKNRLRRYGSPQELAADIQRYLTNEPVEARPPSAWYRARKFVWRHPTMTRRVMLVFVVAAAVWLGYLAASRLDRDGPPGVGATFEDRSIAVLPFENLGGGVENAAFTAGIHDDILNRIAKIGDLRVTSRTSVMEYRSTTKNLRQIGKELGVTTVLEGGVQRSGDQVRINLRLIDVASDTHLWTESFDRKLSAEQIFSIQSDVAGQVAIALQVSLSADERRRIDHLPTTILEAYDAYLKGLEYFHKPGQLEQNLIAARGMFERATELDPMFALAYAGLSRAARDHHWLSSGGLDALHEARRAAERAVEIAPDLSEAHLALGTYYYIMRDYDEALEQLSIAEQGLPGNSELIRWKAFIERRRGMWEEALRGLQRARLLDPRDADASMEIAFTLLNLRRYDEADPYFREALDLAPDYPGAQVYYSLLPLLRDGSAASAQAAADGIKDVAPWAGKYVHGWQAMLSIRDFERARKFVSIPERITGQWHDYPRSLLIGWTYLIEGRAAEADEQFREAAEVLEPDVAERPADARLHTSLGIAYAGLGRFEDAIRAGLRGVELMPIAKDTFVGSWLLHDLGWIYIMAGELDAAVEAFDRVLSIPSVLSIELLLADPRIDPLRDHEGFLALVEKHRRA